MKRSILLIIISILLVIGASSCSYDPTNNDTQASNTDSSINTSSESEVSTESDTTTETYIESETDVNSESNISTESNTDETETDSESELDTDTSNESNSTETEVDSDTSAEIDTTTETETDSDTNTEIDTDTETDMDAESEIDTESETETDDENENDSESETETDNEVETDNVETSKILIVYGDESQLSQIDVEALAEKSGFYIETCESRFFPDSKEVVSSYEKIILMNVDFEEMPTSAPENIKNYVENEGGGLLFTYGDNYYDSDGQMVGNSPIDEILPITMGSMEEQDATAVILVIDLSSSMQEIVDSSSLICEWCAYEDCDGELPDYCPECLAPASFVKPTRYHVALSGAKKMIMGDLSADGGEVLDENDYIGVILFNQGMSVAIEAQKLGDRENREEICKLLQYESDHFYYAYYKTESGGSDVIETDIKINQDDYIVQYGDELVEDENGKKYYWYRVQYTRVEKDENGNYTGNLVNYEGQFLLESGGQRIYAPGGADKATNYMIKSYGTAYNPAIHEASAMMTRVSSNAKIQVKQIVFMSDGAPNDPGSGYEGIVERLANSGTRTTAIGIGLTINNTTALEQLNIISTAGEGDTFIVNNASELQEVLLKIIDEICKGIVDDKVGSTVIPSDFSSVVYQGVKIEAYDIIYGYYVSTIKENASRTLHVDNLRPFYAEWDYGYGKVCVLMTDLGNKEWTASLFDDNDGAANSRLIENILLMNGKRDNK